MKFEKNSKYNTTALLVLIVVAFAAAALSITLNIKEVAAVWAKFYSVISPIVYAFLLMLVLLPIVDFFEEKFKKLFANKKNPEKKARVLSIVCAYLLFFAVITLCVVIIVLQSARAYSFAANFADNYFPLLNGFVSEISDNFSFIEQNLKSILNALNKTFSEWLSDFPSVAVAVAEALGSFVSTLSSWVLATIISIYAMFRREKLKAICRRASAALFHGKANSRVSSFFGTLYRNMIYFYSARAYNSVVLAIVYYIVLLIMGLEFFSLIALIIAVCSFVPVVGTLVGGAIGLFIVFVTNTDKAVWFIVVFLILSVVDRLYFTPKITENRVRVSLGTTIICVFIGYFVSNLLGALFALPLYVTLRTLFFEWRKKKQSIESVKNSAE